MSPDTIAALVGLGAVAIIALVGWLDRKRRPMTREESEDLDEEMRVW